MPSKSKLKIGLILDDSLDKADGVQQYVLGIGEWFRAKGHDVHYLVGETTRSDIQGIHSLSRNIKARFNGNRMSIPLPTSRASLKAELSKEQFDVLHVQIPYSPWLAHRLVSEADDTTVVFGTFHIVAISSVVTAATKVLARWTKQSLKRFDTIVSVSSAAASYAKTTYGIDSQVVPNVVDYARFHDAQPLPEYDDDVVTILFLGRLVIRKGCLQLLRAIVALRAQATTALPAFRVVICGKGPLEAELRAFAAENKLEDIVTFIGFVDEAVKPRYYASADIAVFPSTGGESFGIVLAEALSSGRSTVLAGDNSGYRTVMEPRPELLFDPYNIAELAKKLELYIRKPGARRQAAQWGVIYARKFDVNVVGKRLLKDYKAALRKRRQL